MKNVRTDLMWKMHQLQMVLAGGLCVSFLMMLSTARNAASFVENNWNGCEYPTLCQTLGKADFQLSEYADVEYPGIGMVGFGMVLRPILYACAVSSLMTGVVVIGGSNLAKAVYYNTVMSRKEEVAAQKSGQNQADIRQNALVKKVRQTRDADITKITQEMQTNAVVELEERALVLELATGVPMEVHYDLVAHDDLMLQVNKTANLARHGGDASRGVESLVEDPDDMMANKRKAKQAAKKAAKKAKSTTSSKKKAFVEGDVEGSVEDDDTPEAPTLSGAMQTGSSLANLARQTQLQIHGNNSSNEGSADAVTDARASEGITLDVRIMGAKTLLDKARERHGAWLGINIHTKRDILYETLKRSMDQSDMVLNPFNDIDVGTTFSQRL